MPKSLKEKALEVNISKLPQWLREQVIKDTLTLRDFAEMCRTHRGQFLIVDFVEEYRAMLEWESGRAFVHEHVNDYLENNPCKIPKSLQERYYRSLLESYLHWLKDGLLPLLKLLRKNKGGLFNAYTLLSGKFCPLCLRFVVGENNNCRLCPIKIYHSQDGCFFTNFYDIRDMCKSEQGSFYMLPSNEISVSEVWKMCRFLKMLYHHYKNSNTILRAGDNDFFKK